MRQGVPQGGVLSPVLFNMYMAKIPTPPADILLTTYADDSTTCCSGPKIPPLCEKLNRYLDVVNTWFKERNLMISAQKSSATLFSTWSNEASINLPIFIDGQAVPTIKDPKVLGVTLDPMLSFKPHSQKLNERVRARDKALAGSSWGTDKETLTTTYKATSKSLLDYCCPIWTPSLSDTSWSQLQTSQNSALRTILGCTKMTNIDHLHSESKMMPVKDHCTMLSKQFLLATSRPDHPNHNDIDHVPERVMKPTLGTKFSADIRAIIPRDLVIDDINYKAALRSIHTSSVQQTIQNQDHNRVLGIPAPAIDPSEKTLPRRTRTLLSQLRSGHSTILNSYMARIKPDVTDCCPKCNQSPHDTNHLFNCAADPTDLTPRILWEDPPAAAAFLGLGLEVGDLDDND